ncbi:MAG: regulatory protein RecX [Oscillospiraceae bacterium]|nr:regulatory protein RecX [Oscillospiraceae bacterium]
MTVMRLDSLKPSQRKKGIFLLTMEDGTLLRVTEEEVLRFGLRPGQMLDGETMYALQSSAKISHTRTQAVNMVASRSLSKRELTKRLVQKGSDAEDAQAAADWLEKLGAVNDGEYAATVARHYAARGYGAARVREELRRRGVDRDLWEDALEKLPESSETLDALIRKKCRGSLEDPKEQRRICGALMRRGFSWSEIKTAMGRYTEILED